MKNNQILLLLFLLLSISVKSQNILDNIAFSKSMKLIESGKLEEAYIRINKKLSKEDDMIRNQFAMSLILSDKRFKDYNTDKAYSFLIESEKNYNIIKDEKQIEKLNKTPINDSIYELRFTNIFNKALEDAIQINTIENYNHYLDFYKKSSEENRDIAIEKRNIVAFNTAIVSHTISGYKYFIETYPKANQINDAWSKIYLIAYESAKNKHTIAAYNSFIDDYPKAPQVSDAKKNIHKIAFSVAKKTNTSLAYKEFLETYPNCTEYNEAFELYEESQFLENTINEDWVSYKNFIDDYSDNSKISQAVDSILSIGKKYNNLQSLDYYINNNYINAEEAIEYLYPIFTNDGEESTINLFISRYGTPSSLDDRINDDKYNYRQSSKLLLHLPFDKNKEIEYRDFIISSAPSENAFVALQRLMSYNLSRMRWSSALQILNDYETLFSNNKHYLNLKFILEQDWDKSIVSQSVGRKINNSKGDEYEPVISADNKYLYFCGNDVANNIGGEDILVSRKSSLWERPKLIKDLSTSNYNEAPVNISTDGTTLIIFREGKLYSSEKIKSGWATPVELERSINSGIWNSDVTISSNGEALIFASVREESMNLYTDNENNYHGDNQYPSDIFISLKDKNDIWGRPFNIGDSINTRYTERSPFLHPDMKTLYFSSDGHGGLGKLDVFMTTRLHDSCWTCWSEPINLGKEINTIESNWGYKISTDGKTAYFTKEKTNYKENSLLLLLDISGSMDGEKLESLKEAAIDVCENAINSNSKVSIMAFKGDCQFPINATLPFTNQLDDITIFINSLYAQGGTPMYNAYILAAREITDNAEKNSNKMIILMTDGEATDCGKTLEEALSVIRRDGNKIQTQTIAFMVDSGGIAYNDLNRISNYTGGELFYVENTTSLKSSFAKATSSLYGINTSNTKKEIHTVYLPDHLRPDLVATVEGKVLDSENNPIEAVIRFEDLETEKLIGKIKNNPEDGGYFIVLPLGKIYGLYVDKENYFPISKNLDLRKEKNIIKIENDIPIYTFEEMKNKGIAVFINNIFFNSGLSELTDYSIPELKRITKIIIDNDLTVELSGHTDNVDAEELNLKLSEDRANAVKEFLVNNGCDENKIVTIGYGESKPLNENKNSNERELNRRVEFKFVK